MVFLKDFIEKKKKNFNKKSTDHKHAKLPSMQRDKMDLSKSETCIVRNQGEWIHFQLKGVGGGGKAGFIILNIK